MGDVDNRDSAHKAHDGHEPRIADFSATPQVALLAAVAVPIGAAAACVGLGLLDLIALVTHLAYEGRISVALDPPSLARLGVVSVLVPVVGGVVVGLMARFGSERIRGHGIPEAMQAILVGGSKMEPKLALLKPVSSAVSIGTGGPFGAEGPIIVTGGALGSIVGQSLHLTAAERRTLLVGGAAAGMTAVFGTPVAAVLLGVEVLLFEWRPRSLVPVAFAASSAAVVREAFARAGLMHTLPLFAMQLPAHLPFTPLLAGGALLLGLAAGGLSWVITQSVYVAERVFTRLPVHWMWWPALGGLVVGLGGLVDPRVLGVGYATIGATLDGRIALSALVALLICKLVVWATALGSNTSGGVVAPVLMVGAAFGGLLGALLPGMGVGGWALLGMAAALAGVMRVPLTSIVFAVELTHDFGAMPELLLACGSAYLVSVIVLKRSILTEKVARRGHYVFCEYEVDPLRGAELRGLRAIDLLRARGRVFAEEHERERPLRLRKGLRTRR